MPEIGSASLAIIPSFKGFQRELERGSEKAARAAGQDAGKVLGEEAAEASGDSFGKKAKQTFKVAALAVGTAAGVALGFGIGRALENGALEDKLAAQLGLSGKEAERMGDIAGRLYAGAWGDSLETVNEAVRAVHTNLKGMAGAPDRQLESTTAKVLDIATAFDEEANAITRAADQLTRTGMARNASQALDIITKGFQSGANEAEDLLDTFSEYGTQFRKLGLNGKRSIGLMSQGLKAGARDADTVADALKEFSIRGLEALTKVDSQGNAELTDLGAAFQAVGVNVMDTSGNLTWAGERFQKDLAGGGEKARDALDKVLDGLRNIDNPLERSRHAVALFGTKAEDMGDALFALDLDKTARDIGKVDGAAKRMGDTLNDNAATRITAFKRTLERNLTEFLGNKVIPFVEDKVVPAFQRFGDWFDDEGKDKLKRFGGFLRNDVMPPLKKVARFAEDLGTALDKLPKEVKIGGLAGLAALVGGVKLRGGGGGAAGTVGKALGLAKPIKVFETNPLALGKGGVPGTGGSKVPPVVPGPNGVTNPKNASRVSKLLKAAPLLPAAGALGNDQLPDLMNDKQAADWKRYHANIDRATDFWTHHNERMRTGTIPTVDATHQKFSDLFSAQKQVDNKDPKIELFLPGYTAVDAKLAKLKGDLDYIARPRYIRLNITRAYAEAGRQTRGGLQETTEGGRPAGDTFIHNGNIVANEPRDYERWRRNRARRAAGGGVPIP